MTEKAIKATYVEALEFAPEAPRPLRREVDDPEPFPVHVLGGVLEPAAKAINDIVQAPLPICAQSVLAAATLAVQGFADVVLPTGQARPISLYFVAVAESGERKTTVDEIALQPVAQQEKALDAAHESNLLTYRYAKDAWDSQRRQILSDKKVHKSKSDKEKALSDLGPTPDPPLIPMLTCPEPTYEGLVRLLTEGHPSIGVFSSEAGRLIGGHAMKDEQRTKTGAGLSELWDGQPIKRVRQGDGSSVLLGRRVSLHLMAQPKVASKLLTDSTLRDQGLLSRMLVTYPTPTSGTRMWHDPNPESEAAVASYSAHMLDILSTPLPLKKGKVNELEPRELPLSSGARAAWIDFVNTIESHIGLWGGLRPIRALCNKLPEHAARLAAVLALIDDLECSEVSEGRMEAGIELARYYGSEAMRLVQFGAADDELALAERLLGWLHDIWKDDLVTLTDIYQRGPNSIRDKRKASHVVGILVDHGYLIPVEGGAEIGGTFCHKVWRIIKWTVI